MSRDVRISLQVEGLSRRVARLHVLRLEGEEALSRLFEYRLLLACEDPGLGLSELVGRAALVTLRRQGEGSVRHVHGVICTFELRRRRSRFTEYQVTLVPQVWRLQHVQDSRIFQELTTEQILARVLTRAGVDQESFSVQLQGNQPTPRWRYCVQYRESHWAFMSRPMEELGFYYFFEHGPRGHRLIMGNAYQFHPAIEAPEEVPYHPPAAGLPSMNMSAP